MWILDRSQIALQRADLMFGSIAEDGSLGLLDVFPLTRPRARAHAGTALLEEESG